jgi:hypothetical protein
MSCRLLVCLVVVSLLAGCSKQEPSKAEVFKSDQSATITPHGRIIPESVKETDDGRITYETEDESRWAVDMEKAPDGQYRYGKPEPVKSE